MLQNFTVFLILCFFSINSHLSLAQPNYAPPSGVWCSCPPSTGIGTGSVVPAVASKSYVNGILVRVVWKDIEPSDNTYDWALIDDQITAAEGYGKKISLAVGGGPNSPDWLYALGADSISYTLPFPGTIPVPWDTVFLSKWTEFIGTLSNRYQDDTTIQLVYITNSSTNGFEMQLPYSPSPSYVSLGYTDQLVIDSWKEIMDAFNTGFPNHYLSNDFHPVNSSDAVADSLYTYANQSIANRYGANAWWWTQNNTSVYPSQYAILQNSANSNTFSGIQMAASGTANPTAFGTGGMPEALNLAISNNVCYWEIWNEDILNNAFDSLLMAAECNALGLENFPKTKDHALRLSPNPSTGTFTIALNLHHSLSEVEIVNAMGEIVFVNSQLQGHELSIELSGLSNGVYFVKVNDAENLSYTERLVILK